MGLMDKVKQQAEQALSKAQQGVAQGQAKLDEVQAKRQIDALFRDLGAAYYAVERQGGPADDVAKALAAVDEHVAAQGPVATANTTTTDADAGAPAGDYSLGDL
ncbi:MAG TPA: hypothetical protein VNF71_12900 [Acidimicrobiales bacterium]|nr:hypothetical protein [Acidimicrobiales bacterium]